MSGARLVEAGQVPAVCEVRDGRPSRFVPCRDELGEEPQLIPVVSMDQVMTSFSRNWRFVLPHVAGEALPCASRVPRERVIGAVDRVLSRMLVAQQNG